MAHALAAVTYRSNQQTRLLVSRQRHNVIIESRRHPQVSKDYVRRTLW